MIAKGLFIFTFCFLFVQINGCTCSCFNGKCTPSCCSPENPCCEVQEAPKWKFPAIPEVEHDPTASWLQPDPPIVSSQASSTFFKSSLFLFVTVFVLTNFLN
uniref:Uncharacterized protein n=1 Tax=Panagrolaimus sp. ES5 TaxID=591445 RepID=A0AC34G3L3_9BILA